MTSRVPAFVFDLDGVLANTEHRLHLMEEGPDLFFEGMQDDLPIEATVNMWWHLWSIGNLTMHILTGRPERFRKPTEQWLDKQSIKYDQLIMRPDGSELTVMDYKVDVIKNLIKDYYILAVVEDNPLTAQYLREHTHAPVLLVSSGYYDPTGFGNDPRENKRW